MSEKGRKSHIRIAVTKKGYLGCRPPRKRSRSTGNPEEGKVFRPFKYKRHRL